MVYCPSQVRSCTCKMGKLTLLALMLTMSIIHLFFLARFFEGTIDDLQKISVLSTAKIVKNPLLSANNTYTKQNEIPSTRQVAKQLSPNVKKVLIMDIFIGVAKNQGGRLALLQKKDIAIMPSGPISREHIRLADIIIIGRTSAPSPKPTLSEGTTISPGPKRELTTDSEMSIKQETTNPSITRAVEEASTNNSKITSEQESSTLSRQFTSEAATSSPQSSGQAVKEPSATLLPKNLSTVSSRATREASEQLSSGSISSVFRALFKLVPYPVVMQEILTLSNRSINEALKPSPRTQEVKTSADKIVKEAYRAPLSIFSNRLTRKASEEFGSRGKQKTTIENTYRIPRALSKPTLQGKVSQEPSLAFIDSEQHLTDSETYTKKETTLPYIDRDIKEASTTEKDFLQEAMSLRDGEIEELPIPDINSSYEQMEIPPIALSDKEFEELSSLDLNSSNDQKTTEAREVRDVPNFTNAPLNLEVSRPSGRVFRGILTENQKNDKEENIPSFHKKPFFKENNVMEVFVKQAFSALVEKQVKSGAIKKTMNADDEPTFPPPTDSEGVEL